MVLLNLCHLEMPKCRQWRLDGFDLQHGVQHGGDGTLADELDRVQQMPGSTSVQLYLSTLDHALDLLIVRPTATASNARFSVNSSNGKDFTPILTKHH